MQQIVKLIISPISIFATKTDPAGKNLMKKQSSSIPSNSCYRIPPILLFLFPLVVKYRLNSARATPFIALRLCWRKMAKLIKGIGGHTHKPRHTLT